MDVFIQISFLQCHKPAKNLIATENSPTKSDFNKLAETYLRRRCEIVEHNTIFKCSLHLHVFPFFSVVLKL